MSAARHALSPPVLIRRGLDWSGCSGRLPYLLVSVTVLALTALIPATRNFSGANTALFVTLAMLVPVWLGHTRRRLRDIGWAGWWIWLSVLPVVSLVLITYLSVKPGDAFDGPGDTGYSRLGYAAALLCGAVLLSRAFWAPYWIPTTDMEPTLKVGDFIAVVPVNVLARGDLMVYRDPSTGREHVDRLIGLPGDRVRISGGEPCLEVPSGTRPAAGRQTWPGACLTVGSDPAADSAGGAGTTEAVTVAPGAYLLAGRERGVGQRHAIRPGRDGRAGRSDRTGGTGAFFRRGREPAACLGMAARPAVPEDRMKLSADLEQFQARLGYRFRRPPLLLEAVTHPSIASPTREDNQRLEFLGDRVLGLVMAEALLQSDPDASEGVLAPRFNALVRKETCAAVAREVDLGTVLKLGRSEMVSGGRRKEALLGDAMEAVIAAVYRDGGFEAAQEMVLRLWGERVQAVREDARDAKTALQEWAQARGLAPPAYVETAREGPDHAPRFTIEARLEDGRIAAASAGAKRQAEQAAARALLERLEAT